jgi:hypothetical protein
MQGLSNRLSAYSLSDEEAGPESAAETDDTGSAEEGSGTAS